MADALSAAQQYDRQNQAAAEIILADSARYGGTDAGLVKWALAVMDRVNQDADAGPLFAAS